MLFAIDIGNTNVSLGAFEGENLLASWRLTSDSRRMQDEYALDLQGLLPMKGVSPNQVSEVSLCSVVPTLTNTFVGVSRTLFNIEPLVLTAGTRTGVRILYDNHHDIGADRIADAAAAYHRHGGPTIVVDFGTGTVFDAINKDGAYIGGAIAPGLNVSAEALFLSTSQLRRVELVRPPSAIGKNTVHAMQSGLFLGYLGLVEAMVGHFKDELNAPTAKVIATGGLASLMAKETNAIDFVDEELTLRGLQRIHFLSQTDEQPKKHVEA